MEVINLTAKHGENTPGKRLHLHFTLLMFSHLHPFKLSFQIIFFYILTSCVVFALPAFDHDEKQIIIHEIDEEAENIDIPYPDFEDNDAIIEAIGDIQTKSFYYNYYPCYYYWPYYWYIYCP